MSEKILQQDVKDFIEKSESRIRFSSTSKISLYDILQLMGITNNEKKRIEKYKTAIRKHGIQNLSPTQKWDPETKTTSVINNAKETPCCDLAHTIKFMGFYLPKSNLDKHEIKDIIDTFQLPESVITSSAQEEQPHTEKEIMKSLMKALPWECSSQFSLGNYRLDLYIPQFKIAVECDEFGHAQYNRLDEERRERFISDQLNCKWVRFDPYVKDFCIFDVLRSILKHAIC